MRKTAHIVIEGRVQGVGYRDWTARTALALGLDGWVRNRSDGTVEAVFSGTGEAVSDMLARCREGPRAAAVTRIETLASEGNVPTGFEIRGTE